MSKVQGNAEAVNDLKKGISDAVKTIIEQCSEMTRRLQSLEVSCRDDGYVIMRDFTTETIRGVINVLPEVQAVLEKLTKYAEFLECDYTDWSRTSLTAEQEQCINKLAAEGKLDVFEPDGSSTEPREPLVRLPKRTGKFSGERGNSRFYPNSEEAMACMREYGVDFVEYKKNEPDFSPFTRQKLPWGEVTCQVQIGHMTGYRKSVSYYGPDENGTSHSFDRYIGNYEQGDNELAALLQSMPENKDVIITGAMVRKYREANNLTWHECSDGKTMQLIPTVIHDACKHTGGTAQMGYVGKMGDITIQ